MTNLDDGILLGGLPAVWTELPTSQDNTEDKILEILNGLELDDAAARRLDGSLRMVIAVAEQLPEGARHNYALIADTGGMTVQALLSVRVSWVTSDAYDNYLAAARSLESNDQLEVIRRTVEEVVLPVGRGVLSKDFTLPKSGEGVPDPAMERTFLALFPGDRTAAVEFTLLTQNLAAFDDAGGYLLALAENEYPALENTGMPS